MEYQVLVYGFENEILSSQHYNSEPTQSEVIKLINEDDGIIAEVYEVNGDYYSKHLVTYETI
jgi:hypothetical protein